MRINDDLTVPVIVPPRSSHGNQTQPASGKAQEGRMKV